MRELTAAESYTTPWTHTLWVMQLPVLLRCLHTSRNHLVLNDFTFSDVSMLKGASDAFHFSRRLIEEKTTKWKHVEVRHLLTTTSHHYHQQHDLFQNGEIHPVVAYHPEATKINPGPLTQSVSSAVEASVRWRPRFSSSPGDSIPLILSNSKFYPSVTLPIFHFLNLLCFSLFLSVHFALLSSPIEQ